MLKSHHVKWALSLILPIIVYCIVPESVHPKFPLFFAITTWTVTVWATDILPAVPVAAAMTFLFVLLKVAPPPVVFGAWASFLPWICFAALILSDALEETGLTRRLALKLMILVGATFKRVVISLMLVGIFMAFLLPDVMCRVIIFVAIAHGLVLALNLPAHSRISSAIIMAGFCAATSPGYGFLTGTEMALIAKATADPLLPAPIAWMDYFIANGPFILLYCAFSCFMCIFIILGKEHLPDEGHLQEAVRLRLQEMGPMTAKEWKLLTLMLLAITGLLTQKFHGMPGTFLYAAIVLLAYLPPIGLAKPEGVRHLNVSFLIFVVGCLGMGSVAVHLGAAKWFASILVPFMEGLSSTWVVFTAFMSSVCVNFMLTPLAAVSSLSGPMVEIAQQLNMNPAPLLYAFLYGLDQYIFPYEYALFMYIFTTGYATPKHMIGGLALRILFVSLGLLLLQVPYWHLLGLFK